MTARGHDWLTIVLGLACLALLGGGGAAICMFTAVPPGTYFISPRIVIWVRWGAQLVGKLPGLALGGAFLGAYLRRVNPWHVLAGVAVYIICVDALDVFVGTRAASSMIAVMGVTLALALQSISFATSLGAIATGIWFGQKSRHSPRP
jgi:hypothetical protein